MKKKFILNCDEELECSVLAINSHIKVYKLCWQMNNVLKLNFEKKNDLKVKEDLFFSRHQSFSENGVEYNLLANHSKKGCLIPTQKSVNFFLCIKNDFWEKEKKEFINKLKEIKDILLIFELKTNSTKYMHRFIFNDTKN